MIDLDQGQVKRLTAVHGWSAVVLGLLLYAVILTGVVAVFAGEIGRWSVGGVRERDPLAGPVGATVASLAAEVDPAFLGEGGIWSGEGGDLHVFFHDHKLNPATGDEEDFGTMFRAEAATGRVLERHEGFIWEDPAAWETSALRQFLVDLHVQLYLPSPWGLILTGILGLMMMAAVVSGVLMHRHLVRDLFIAERPGQRLVSVRDRHVLAGSWGIPFAFVLAFTGSFFSFAGAVSFPIVAATAFGGDQEAMAEVLYEPPVAEDATPRAAADLDAMMADSRARAPGEITYIGLAQYGRADARVSLWHEPAEGGLQYVTNVYDGATGAFLERQAPLGTGPSLGGSLYGLMAPLHFGHFAGLLSKAVWGALGVAMCYVVLTGYQLWLKRRGDDPQWQAFGRVVQVTGYGLPLAMLASAYGFFLSRPAGDAFWWTPASFLVGAVLAVLVALAVPDAARQARAYRRIMGAMCLGLPVLRLATGGMDWAEAVLAGQHDVLTVDLLFIVAGGWLWLHGRGLRLAARRVPAE